MKKSKHFLRCTAALAAALLTAGLPLSAPGTASFASYLDGDYTFGDNGTFTYEKYSDHIAVIGINSDTANLVIPSEIDGTPVTEIGIYAFQYSIVESITFPETITAIGPYAFTNCEKLKSVTFPDSLQTIRWQCFTDCSALSEVNFPSHPLQTGDYDFENTPWLTAQRAKDPLVIVNDSVIDGRTCSGEVKIPKSVKYVASGAFAKNENITSVYIPSGVSTIADNTFFQCSALTSAEIEGCTALGYGVFQECSKLTDLKLSGKLKTIDQYTFADNSASATITFYGSESTWNQVSKPADDPFLQRARMVFDESHHEEEETVIGDINGDGACTVADAVMLQKYLLTTGTLTADQAKIADMNEDGRLDGGDLTLLKQHILSGN